MSLFAQCILVVSNNSNFELNSNGEGILYIADVDNGSYNGCDLEIALYDINNMVELIPYGDSLILNCDHIGDKVFRIRDIGSGNSIWAGITILDSENACTSSTDDIYPQLSYSMINGILDIELPAGVETDLHVYNVVGKLMMSQKISPYTSTVDMTVLEQKGIYIISAMIDKKIRSKKIVVW